MDAIASDAQRRLAPLVPAALAGAAGLHLAAARSHRGAVIVMAFFLGAALVQLVTAMAYAFWPSRRTGLFVIVSTLALVGLWGASRAAGLPVGHEAAGPEPVGLLDGITIGVELVAVAGVLLGTRTAGVRRWATPVLVGVFLLAGASGMAIATTSHTASPHHHTKDESHQPDVTVHESHDDAEPHGQG